MNIVTVAALLVVGAAATTNNSEKPLPVTLFYESYCPDCTAYIQDQLVGAWNTLHDDIVLDLVPFGNAYQKFVDGHWEFRCQHGPKECLGNKLHACVIHHACGGMGTTGCDVSQLGHVISYLDCVTRHGDQLAATKQCAEKEGLDAQKVVTCANNQQGDDLLSKYGQQTLDFWPKISSVPTVAIDGKRNVNAEKNLTAEICRLRPSYCRQPVVVNV